MIILEQLKGRDMEIAPPSDTYCIHIKRGIVCPSLCASFHWFKCFAYLKLGISASFDRGSVLLLVIGTFNEMGRVGRGGRLSLDK